MLRDLTGQTFFKQRIAQFTFAFAGLKAMLRGEAAQKTGASTTAGTPCNQQSDDGMTSPTIDLSGQMAVARPVGRFLTVHAAPPGPSHPLFCRPPAPPRPGPPAHPPP